jgi:hypothetical protein
MAKLEPALSDQEEILAIAAAGRRGTTRLLLQMGLTPLAEVALPTGRRLDLLALGADGRFLAVEIKSCRQDFTSDRKWPEYLPWADSFCFAVAPEFPLDLLPSTEGLIVADRFEGAMLREGPVRPLQAARRKALTLRFARIAAARANGLADPEL